MSEQRDVTAREFIIERLVERAWTLVQALEDHYPELVADPDWPEVRDLKETLGDFNDVR